MDMALVCPDSPSPLWSCGPRGSGGGRRGRKEEPKALGFPREEAGSSAPLLLPAQAPSSWSWAFPLLPRSPGLLSSALELSWSLGLIGGACSGSSSDSPSLSRRTVAANSHLAHSGAPLPHICR